MIVVMYVAKVPNRGSPPAVLLRESYREAGKVKNRTLANLSSWPEAKVNALARVLKGRRPAPAAAPKKARSRSPAACRTGMSPPCWARRGRWAWRRCSIPWPSRQRDLVTAMAVAQVIAPDSKLAIARGLREESAASSLGQVLGAGGCDEDDLYAAMDWLAARQDRIQKALAARHLAGGTLVLYDVSSAAFEGRTCPPGAIGHPKDGVPGSLQVVYRATTPAPDGVPVAIEVFEGSTGDPTTVASQVAKVKDRFGLTRVVLVGRPGHADRRAAALGCGPCRAWTGSPRCAPRRSRRWSATARCSCPSSMRRTWRRLPIPDYPGERLVACKNPFLEAERARKRESLLAATETDLEKIAAATPAETPAAARPGQDRAARRPGAAPPQGRQALRDRGSLTTSFSYARNQESITAEAALDGIYVLRTSAGHRRPRKRRGGLLLQGARPGGAGVPGLQYRPGHPPDPPPHRDPGPRARVLADAVVLPHLAHARPPRAAAVHRR